TRPDMANAVRELSKFLSCYNRTHWDAARRVLKYLKGTSTYRLYLDGKARYVTYEVYTDVSFARQPKERTGYVIQMMYRGEVANKEACFRLLKQNSSH
ncbi:putative mitochondrial protein, partial [Phytophthora megakarya]